MFDLRSRFRSLFAGRKPKNTPEEEAAAAASQDAETNNKSEPTTVDKADEGLVTAKAEETNATDTLVSNEAIPGQPPIKDESSTLVEKLIVEEPVTTSTAIKQSKSTENVTTNEEANNQGTSSTVDLEPSAPSTNSLIYPEDQIKSEQKVIVSESNTPNTTDGNSSSTNDVLTTPQETSETIENIPEEMNKLKSSKSNSQLELPESVNSDSIMDSPAPAEEQLKDATTKQKISVAESSQPGDKTFAHGSLENNSEATIGADTAVASKLESEETADEDTPTIEPTLNGGENSDTTHFNPPLDEEVTKITTKLPEEVVISGKESFKGEVTDAADEISSPPDEANVVAKVTSLSAEMNPGTAESIEVSKEEIILTEINQISSQNIASGSLNVDAQATVDTDAVVTQQIESEQIQEDALSEEVAVCSEQNIDSSLTDKNASSKSELPEEVKASEISLLGTRLTPTDKTPDYVEDNSVLIEEKTKATETKEAAPAEDYNEIPRQTSTTHPIDVTIGANVTTELVSAHKSETERASENYQKDATSLPSEILRPTVSDPPPIEDIALPLNKLSKEVDLSKDIPQSTHQKTSTEGEAATDSASAGEKEIIPIKEKDKALDFVEKPIPEAEATEAAEDMPVYKNVSEEEDETKFMSEIVHSESGTTQVAQKSSGSNNTEEEINLAIQLSNELNIPIEQSSRLNDTTNSFDTSSTSVDNSLTPHEEEFKNKVVSEAEAEIIQYPSEDLPVPVSKEPITAENSAQLPSDAIEKNLIHSNLTQELAVAIDETKDLPDVSDTNVSETDPDLTQEVSISISTEENSTLVDQTKVFGTPQRYISSADEASAAPEVSSSASSQEIGLMEGESVPESTQTRPEVQVAPGIISSTSSASDEKSTAKDPVSETTVDAHSVPIKASPEQKNFETENLNESGDMVNKSELKFSENESSTSRTLTAPFAEKTETSEAHEPLADEIEESSPKENTTSNDITQQEATKSSRTADEVPK